MRAEEGQLATAGKSAESEREGRTLAIPISRIAPLALTRSIYTEDETRQTSERASEESEKGVSAPEERH